VQETFVLLWQALPRLPDDVRVYAYARVVARRLVHAHVAARALVEPVPGDEVPEPVRVAPAELDHAVRQALAALPSQQRTAVGYRVFTGLSRSTAARALGVTPRQVDTLVARALLALRREVR
jgi:RNA polymerase sigma factor (sigma-70 family)